MMAKRKRPEFSSSGIARIPGLRSGCMLPVAKQTHLLMSGRGQHSDDKINALNDIHRQLGQQTCSADMMMK